MKTRSYSLTERALLGEHPGQSLPEIIGEACLQSRTMAEAAERLRVSMPTLRLLRARYGEKEAGISLPKQ